MKNTVELFERVLAPEGEVPGFPNVIGVKFTAQAARGIIGVAIDASCMQRRYPELFGSMNFPGVRIENAVTCK